MIADIENPELLTWLQEDSNLALFSYLSDLEYHVYDEFHTFLHFPILMFQFKRFSSTIDLKAKVFGLGHGVIPITAVTTLGNVQNITIDSTVRDTWRQQLFFSITCALKHDYFDKFLTIHSLLDSFKNY